MGALRRGGLILVLGLLAVFLQGAVLQPLLRDIPTPNLVLLLVIYLGFYEVNFGGAGLSFLLGLELDLFGRVLLGPWAGACVFMFAVLALITQRVFVDSWLVVMVAALLSSVVSGLLYNVIFFQFDYAPNAATFSLALGEALITAICAPPVFALLRRLMPARDVLGLAGGEAGRT